MMTLSGKWVLLPTHTRDAGEKSFKVANYVGVPPLKYGTALRY